MDLATGAVTGWDPTANSVPGVYAVAASSKGLAVGGDFDQVGTDQARQRGIAVFAPVMPEGMTGITMSWKSRGITYVGTVVVWALAAMARCREPPHTLWTTGGW